MSAIQTFGCGRHGSRGVCLPWLSYPLINRKHLRHRPPKCHHSCCHAELRKSDLEVMARHFNEVEAVQPPSVKDDVDIWRYAIVRVACQKRRRQFKHALFSGQLTLNSVDEVFLALVKDFDERQVSISLFVYRLVFALHQLDALLEVKDGII